MGELCSPGNARRVSAHHAPNPFLRPPTAAPPRTRVICRTDIGRDDRKRRCDLWGWFGVLSRRRAAGKPAVRETVRTRFHGLFRVYGHGDSTLETVEEVGLALGDDHAFDCAVRWRHLPLTCAPPKWFSVVCMVPRETGIDLGALSRVTLEPQHHRPNRRFSTLLHVTMLSRWALMVPIVRALGRPTATPGDGVRPRSSSPGVGFVGYLCVAQYTIHIYSRRHAPEMLSFARTWTSS